MIFRHNFSFHILFILFITFTILTFNSCKQNTESLHDFIQESLEYYILNGTKKNETNNNKSNSLNYDNDYIFSFSIKRNSTYFTEDLSDFVFLKNDTIYLLNDYDDLPLYPLYFSLYREAELIIQEKASSGLCLTEKVFQFPGKYTFAVTFQTNKIIQEACFQIIIE